MDWYTHHAKQPFTEGLPRVILLCDGSVPIATAVFQSTYDFPLPKILKSMNTSNFSRSSQIANSACFTRFSEAIKSLPGRRAVAILAVSGGADSTAMFRCAILRKRLEQNNESNEPDEIATNMVSPTPMEGRLSKTSKQTSSSERKRPPSVPSSGTWIKGANFTIPRFIVAHFDHGVRENSAADAAFVQNLATRWEIPCVVERRSATDSERDGNSESALRNARYRFLRRVAEQYGADTVWFAHTLDDQTETVLHRILRGTGLRGLAGIPTMRPLGEGITIFRPLLEVDRSEIVAFLAALGQEWREDESNTREDYTRNRIRHTLLPLLESEFAPGARGALRRLATIAAECGRVIDAQVETLYAQVVRRENRGNKKNSDNAETPSPHEVATAMDRRGERRPADGSAASRRMIREEDGKDSSESLKHSDHGKVNENIQILRTPLAEVDDYLVKELFAKIWREEGWPQREMGYEQWDSLLKMFRTRLPRCQMYPGAILATNRRTALVLRKELPHRKDANSSPTAR